MRRRMFLRLAWLLTGLWALLLLILAAQLLVR